MDNPELLKKLKHKDENAFREIVNNYQKMILNTCYRFVYNKEAAEDITQEVFIEVYRSVKLFRSESKFSTWIYRIAVTKSLDYLKFQKRKKRFSLLRNLMGSDSGTEEFPSTEYSPEKQIENDERVRILREAIDKLPENQKIAFTLSKYDDLSYQEISEILGTTISSVESLIHRAKINLRKKLYIYYNKLL